MLIATQSEPSGTTEERVMLTNESTTGAELIFGTRKSTLGLGNLSVTLDLILLSFANHNCWTIVVPRSFKLLTMCYHFILAYREPRENRIANLP